MALNTVQLEAEIRTKLNQAMTDKEVEKLQKSVDKITPDKGFKLFYERYDKLANMKIKGFDDFEQRQQSLKQLEGVFGESRTKEYKSAMQAGVGESDHGAVEKSLGGLLDIGLKIAAGVSIAVALGKVFEPAVRIANNILRMIAEFLRPIAVLVQTLLSPILTMLRPVLQVFRTMLQPYLKAALTLSRDAAKDMISGLTGQGVLKSLLAMDTVFLGLQNAIVKGTWETTKLLIDAMFQVNKIIVQVLTVGFASMVGGLGLLLKASPGAALTGADKAGDALVGAAGSLAASGGIITATLDAYKNNFFQLGDTLVATYADAIARGIETTAAGLGTNIEIPKQLTAGFQQALTTFTATSVAITQNMFADLQMAWSAAEQEKFAKQAGDNFLALFGNLWTKFDQSYNDTKKQMDTTITGFWTAFWKANQDAMTKSTTAKQVTAGEFLNQNGYVPGKGIDFNALIGLKDKLMKTVGNVDTKQAATDDIFKKLTKDGYTSLADATIASLTRGGVVHKQFDVGLGNIGTTVEGHFTSQSDMWKKMYGAGGTIANTTKQGADSQVKSIENVNAAAKVSVSITAQALSQVQAMGTQLVAAYNRINQLVQQAQRAQRGGA